MTESPIATHPAFEHRRSRRVDTLNLTVHEFAHRRTGALHYHLASPHDENVFVAAFRTVPMDSSGVAHILEHTTLCGSERYPVRDPFFAMTRRSLNTFMNAFTTNDYTAYPFASQNRKDFFNLMDIYLDCVFFPRLDRLDFAQEGHRLEFEDPEDPASPLRYRGVVYNEMKGDSSSPVSVLYEHLKALLFPTTTYHYNSGGDPRHIPALSYDDLVAFHRSHYHPSNGIFMTFGAISPAELQAEMQDRALSRFEPMDKRIAVAPERRYTEPVRAEAPYAVEDEAATRRRTHVVFGWLLGPNTDLEMLLKCNLLSDVLLDTSASPLRRALEGSELGTAASPLCGLEENNHEMSFMCGLEGSEVHHADAVEQLVMDTLQRVADEGVAHDRVEAVLHQLELHQREIGGDGLPYGLQLIFSCMAAAVHRGDPIDLLDLDPILEKLREDIKDPGFIKDLTRELLLDNPHRVRLTLYPDYDLANEEAEAEASALRERANSLTQAQRQELVDLARRLKERQEAEEDLSVLPRVGLEDVQPDLPLPRGTEHELAGGGRLTSYAAGTNGLVYHQIVTHIADVEQELLDDLPMYTPLVSELGSGGRDYLETQHLQHSTSGGISVYAAIRAATDDVNAARGYLTTSSRTLNDKAGEMIRLLRETRLELRFDELDRIRELVHQIRARREAGITGSGHVYAMSAASSGVRGISALNHRLSGLAGLSRLIALDEALEDPGNLAAFAERLAALHDLLNGGERRFLLVSDEGFLDRARESVAAAWADEPSRERTTDLAVPPVDTAQDQAWLTSTQVNFCATAFATVEETHPDSAALTVLAGVLRNGYLHKAIREQGGAYGAGAGHDMSAGVFRFYSYRDPNLMRTFDAFCSSVEWAKAGGAGASEVEEAILGVIAGIDAPGSPAGEARQAFHNDLFGRTADHRRWIRQAILDVTPDDVQRVAGTHLGGTGSRAVVTSGTAAGELPASFERHSIT